MANKWANTKGIDDTNLISTNSKAPQNFEIWSELALYQSWEERLLDRPDVSKSLSMASWQASYMGLGLGLGDLFGGMA